MANQDEAASVEMVSPPAPARPGEPEAASRETPVALPQIAYVYGYTLEAPSSRIGGLIRAHEQACVQAGLGACQVIGSNDYRDGDDLTSARLELRATPPVMTRLRARLATDAEAVGGGVVASSTTSEDLSRQIIDTEARLRATETLRDRLQQLLSTRSGSLEELLKVESELARVQGELDATRSTLEMMRQRVATSRLVIHYQATGTLAPDSAFRPVSAAMENALAAFMWSVAGLILAVAALAPLALILTPLVIWARRHRRARRALTPSDAPAGRSPPSGPDSGAPG